MKQRWCFRNKQTPWPLVRKRTIPAERPPLVGEILVPTFVDGGVSLYDRGGSPAVVNDVSGKQNYNIKYVIHYECCSDVLPRWLSLFLACERLSPRTNLRWVWESELVQVSGRSVSCFRLPPKIFSHTPEHRSVQTSQREQYHQTTHTEETVWTS
jgi:hypothetical protein